jgi:hypothetical protein
MPVKRATKKRVAKKPTKRGRKPRMKGGVDAQTHYSLYPDKSSGPYSGNKGLEKIHTILEYIEPFLLF